MKIDNPRLKRKKEQLKKIKIIIFIEKIIRYQNDNGENIIYMLLDFPIKNSNINIFFERIQSEFTEGASMLEIKNIKFDETGIIPREGHYYYMPDSLIEGFNWVEYNQNNSDSSNYIRLSSDGLTNKIKFEKAFNYKALAEDKKPTLNLKKGLKTFDKINSSKIEIDIYDVGQGNWNEICFNDNFLITYDLGASSSSVFLDTYNSITTTQLRNLKINSILKTNFDWNKILIISHWDIDHYNGIFDISDNILENYNFCLVPNKIENLTTQRAFDKLLRNTVVYPIEMNNKGRGIGASSVLTEIYSSPVFKLYKGTKCSDRNKRGLLLSLHAKNMDFIFPADHHYNQIENYIIPNCINRNFNLVVPHHGGNAGNYNLIRSWIHCNHSIISTNGRYGHPKFKILNNLNTTFHSVYRTDISSNFNIVF